jgi:quinoprotein glucose dehydrogenase
VFSVNARTGELEWTLDTIPKSIRKKTGTANVWTAMSADENLGLLYLPVSCRTTGAATAPVDAKVRTLALATGKELWQDIVEARAVANPAVYEYQGREYVAFVAGGSSILKDQVGDQAAVYALPK